MSAGDVRGLLWGEDEFEHRARHTLSALCTRKSLGSLKSTEWLKQGASSSLVLSLSDKYKFFTGQVITEHLLCGPHCSK